MIPVSVTPPPRPFRTGVHDAAGSPDKVDTGNLPAGIIRRIWYIGNPDNQIKTWCQDVVDGGGYPMPCMDAGGYSGGADYAERIAGLLDTNPVCEWIELDNEPVDAGTQGSVLNRHLDMIAAAGPRIHARGYKVLLTYFIDNGIPGGFGVVANALDAGTRGATWEHVDGIAYHQYPAEPSDVINSLNSFRGQIDAHAGAADKRLVLNETGWPCATRADGTGNPADWSPRTPYWHLGPDQVNRTILLAEQANKISNGTNGLVDLLTPDAIKSLKMLGFCWFAYEDYPSYPTGDAYGHCGLRDVTGAARPALARMEAQPFVLNIQHWHAPPVATTKTVTLTQSGSGTNSTITAKVNGHNYGFSTTAGGQVDAQTGATILFTRSGSIDFDHWTLDGVDAGTGTTLSVSMMADHAVVAVKQTIAPPADFYVDDSSTPGGDGTVNTTTGIHRAFATIQAGVNAAGAGQTVQVQAGTYAEAVQITKNNITIQGTGLPAVTGSNTRAACFNMPSHPSNVMIDGFEMKDIRNAGTAGAILATSGATACTFSNNVIHDVTGGGGTTSAGIHLERGAAESSHDNTIADNEIYNIGISNTVDTGEHMGIYVFAHRNNTYLGNTIYNVRKEGIRDYIGVNSTYDGNHIFLCWEGMTFNGGAGHLVRNNAFHDNECGLSLKHTSVTTQPSNLTDGGWTGTPASYGYTRVWHNTFWGNIAADIDMGQGYIWDYADVQNNIFASAGDCRLRFFGLGQGHFIVDHNSYPSELGSTVFFQDATGFSMAGPDDSGFPLTTSNVGHNNGQQGLPWDTNGSTAAPEFSGGNPAYSNTLTGANLPASDGLGTQVGAVGIGAAAASFQRWAAVSATSTAGGTPLRLINGKWKYPAGEFLATAQSGTLTLDLGLGRSTNVVVMHTEISQTDAGIPNVITIDTSLDGVSWTPSGLGTITNVGTRGSSYKYVFPSPIASRYVRMVITSTHGAPIRIMELEAGLLSSPIIKNLVTDYGDVTQATIASAVADAKTQLTATPNVTYIVQIPAGTWDLSTGGSGQTINLSNVVAGSAGRFILTGAGREATTLVLNDDLIGINASNFQRITIANMTMTRPLMKVTQGTVVSVAVGEVVLRIQTGFPLPMDLHSGESGKGAGRYLRKFTNSASDPQLVVTGNNQEEWEDATLVSGRDWTMNLNDPDIAPYGVGDLVAVKSKHGGDAYKFTTGDDVFFSNVTWLQESRGAFRHVNNVRVDNSQILRAPAISGQVPCLSTPDGGPQVGQPGDLPIIGAAVTNCRFVGTGDDGIAFFNATGVARDNYIQDAFARGINLYHTDPNVPPAPVTEVRTVNNTMVRCAIEDTSDNQRT